MLAQLTQESSNAGAGAAAGILIIAYLAFIVIYLVGMWKLFTKPPGGGGGTLADESSGGVSVMALRLPCRWRPPP